MAVMFQVDVFWVVTPCSVVSGYQRFRGPCCLHFQGETLVSYHNATRRHKTEYLELEVGYLMVPFLSIFYRKVKAIAYSLVAV
jgi:hypothetical protein